MSPKGGLRDLLIDEMRDLYDADKQLVKALATMARAATAESLVTLCRFSEEVRHDPQNFR